MEIVVLQGSPNANGSTGILVDQFTRGAQNAGHHVQRFDVCRMNITPCTGCLACGYEGPCSQHDDMDRIRAALLEADMVVFATPLYYYGMTAQLKTVVDRFCSANSSLHAKHLDSALLAVAWNADGWTFDALMAHYNTLVRYMGLNDRGTVLGYGCGTTGMTNGTPYPRAAYNLGNSL